MTNETWREEFYRKCDLRIEKGGFTYLYERDDVLCHDSIANFIQSEIDKAVRGEVERVQQNMLETCRDWHGSGEAMINDYLNNLK